MLVPRFHRFYWLGLSSTTDVWPKFRWLDPYVPVIESRRGYKNWGTALSDDGSFTIEPSNPAETCGGANWPMQRGSPPSWGWTGRDCASKHVFICRVMGGCTRARSSPARPAAGRCAASPCAPHPAQPAHHALSPPHLGPPPRAEDGYSEPFTVNSTGVQFYINTTYGPFMEAEENCQYNGGHLATYTGVAEQVRGPPAWLGTGQALASPAAPAAQPLQPGPPSPCRATCHADGGGELRGQQRLLHPGLPPELLAGLQGAVLGQVAAAGRQRAQHRQRCLQELWAIPDPGAQRQEDPGAVHHRQQQPGRPQHHLRLGRRGLRQRQVRLHLQDHP
jgi:hypothetical protein